MIGLRRHSRSGSSTEAPQPDLGTPEQTTLTPEAALPAPPSSILPKPWRLRRGRRADRANKASRARKASETKRFGRPRRLGSVQQCYVSAEAVIGDMLVLATHAASRAGRNRDAPAREYRAILEVSSVNYALKTEGEQEAILAGYRAFLNGLMFPVQILVQVRPLDLAPYLARVRAARDQALAILHTRLTHTAKPAPAVARGVGDTEVTRSAAEDAEAVWVRLADEEERYVLELAARQTLLERHFYLVIPAEDGAGTTGMAGSGGGVGRLDSGVSEGTGLRLPGTSPSLPSWLPLPGRRRRREAAAAREFVWAEKQLTLRAGAVARELERFGLETRRLSRAELAAVYYRAVAPDAAARFPIRDSVLAGVGGPLTAVMDTGCDQQWYPATRDASGVSLDPETDEDSGDFVDARATDERTTGHGLIAQFANGDLADVVAPASVTLARDEVRLDDTFCRTLAVVGYPRHVYAGWLERLIDLDEPLDVVLHIHPQSTSAMIRQLSHRLVQLHSSRLLNEERGRVGHPELGVAYRDVEQMRERLQRGDERIFATSLYLHIRAPALPEGAPGLGPSSAPPPSASARTALDDRVARVETALANQQLVARQATFEQDLALLSCLPEGRDRLLRTRLLDTSSLATAFPFVSNSLSMPGGILLGSTANGSPVFIDAFAPELENANKVVFAKSGAGKSYACKVEALRSLLRGTDVYVVDPEAEYAPLAAAVGGQTVRLAAGAHQHLNPFDLPTLSASADREVAREVSVGASAGGDVLADKVQSLHALLDLLLADRGPTGTAGLSQREKGLLDRALYEVYRRADITSDPATHRRPAPLLRDLYDVLVGGSCGADDAHLAERLHRYVHGSLSGLFAAPTNVELWNRLVVFDVRDLDAELRPLGLFLIAEFVWTRIRRERRPRLLVIDEAWTLMQYQEGGRFLAGLARRARKYYLGLITITQDAQDFLSSEHGRTVLANSSVQLLMKQDSSTIEAVSKAFRLSGGERQYLLGCHKGEGLLFARGGHVALQIGASPFEHELATTDPRELAARERAARSTEATRAVPPEHGTRAARSGRSGRTARGPGRSFAPRAERAPSAGASRRLPAEQEAPGWHERDDAQAVRAGGAAREAAERRALDETALTFPAPGATDESRMASGFAGHGGMAKDGATGREEAGAEASAAVSARDPVQERGRRR